MATSLSLDVTLELGDLGAVDLVLECAYSPATRDYFDKPLGVYLPGNGEEIEVSRIFVCRNGKTEPAPEIELLVERLGFNLEEHFAEAIREAHAARNAPPEDRDE